MLAPLSSERTALSWLLPGSTVTHVTLADVPGPRLISGGRVPVRIEATFDRATAPGHSARRRVEVILGQLYGGSWSGQWGTGTGTVMLTNTGCASHRELGSGGM